MALDRHSGLDGSNWIFHRLTLNHIKIRNSQWYVLYTFKVWLIRCIVSCSTSVDSLKRILRTKEWHYQISRKRCYSIVVQLFILSLRLQSLFFFRNNFWSESTSSFSGMISQSILTAEQNRKIPWTKQRNFHVMLVISSFLNCKSYCLLHQKYFILVAFST